MYTRHLMAVMIGLAMGGVCMSAQAAPAGRDSTHAYEQVMAAMHQRMSQPLSGNADVDFVRQMIPHHQAAVAMAKIQLAYGKDEGLKTFSRWVIAAQEQEIGYMKQWLRRRDNGRSYPGAKDYYGPAMQQMHHAMMIDYTGDADVDFARGMIAHHQGAVAMAGILMAHGTDPELRTLGDAVFRAQTYEIAWQQYWLAHPHSGVSFPAWIY